MSRKISINTDNVVLGIEYLERVHSLLKKASSCISSAKSSLDNDISTSSFDTVSSGIVSAQSECNKIITKSETYVNVANGNVLKVENSSEELLSSMNDREIIPDISPSEILTLGKGPVNPNVLNDNPGLIQEYQYEQEIKKNKEKFQKMGLTDTDINRLIKGEISIEALYLEITNDSNRERYRALMESEYLEKCSYSHEKAQENLDKLNTEKEEINQRLNEINSASAQDKGITNGNTKEEKNSLESRLKEINKLIIEITQTIEAHKDNDINFNSMAELDEAIESCNNEITNLSDKLQQVQKEQFESESFDKFIYNLFNGCTIEEALAIPIAYSYTTVSGAKSYSFDLLDYPNGDDVTIVTYGDLYGDAKATQKIIDALSNNIDESVDYDVLLGDIEYEINENYEDYFTGNIFDDSKVVETEDKLTEKIQEKNMFIAIKNSINESIDYYFEYIDKYILKNDFNNNNKFNESFSELPSAVINSKEGMSAGEYTAMIIAYFINDYTLNENERKYTDGLNVNGEHLSNSEHTLSMYKDYLNTHFGGQTWNYDTGFLETNSNISQEYAHLIENYSQKWRNIMTNEEINVFNYICNTMGYAQGFEYLNNISSNLDKRYVQNEQAKDADYAHDHPFLASLGSIFAKPIEGIGGFAYSIECLLDNVNMQRSNLYSSADTWRGTVSEDIRTLNGYNASFWYNTFMSMGDSGLVIALTSLTGGGSLLFSTTVMGSSVYLSTLNSALDRGIDQKKAVVLALGCSAIESLMESYSVGHLIGLEKEFTDVLNNSTVINTIIEKLSGKGISSTAATKLAAMAYCVIDQALVEGDEELWTEIFDYAIDTLIAGDLSNRELSIKKYQEEHPGHETDAYFNEFKNLLNDVCNAWLGGAASGIFFGFGAGKRASNEINQNVSGYQMFVDYMNKQFAKINTNSNSNVNLNGNIEVNADTEFEDNSTASNENLKSIDEIIEEYLSGEMDSNSKYSIRDLLDIESYRNLLSQYLELAPTSQSQEVLSEILFNGGYGDYSFDSNYNTQVRDNSNIEFARRLSMATLYLTNPTTFLTLAKNGINTFHGTNSINLESIIENGLQSGVDIENSGQEVITGEKSTRTNGQRKYVSFTNIFELAYSYAKTSDTNNFGIIVCTTNDNINNSQITNVGSDLSEVGVLGTLSSDKIKAILVPSDKVDSVKEMVGDKNILVLPMDGYDLRIFDLVDGGAYSNTYSLENLKEFVSQNYKDIQVETANDIQESNEIDGKESSKNIFNSIWEMFSNNGEFDIQKINDLLFNHSNEEAVEYLLKKLPEFFVRGGEVFNNYFDFCLTDNSMSATEILSQIKDGNLEIIKQFEELFPSLEKLSKFLNQRITGRLADSVQRTLWQEGRIILDSWQTQYEKFLSVYQDIIKNNGAFEYNGEMYYGLDAVDKLVKTNSQDTELLTFIKKIIKYFEFEQNGSVFKKFDQALLDREIKAQEERKEQLAKLEKELNEITEKLEEYNFLTMQLNEDIVGIYLVKKMDLTTQIESLQRRINNMDQWISDKEEEKIFLNQYIEKYLSVIKNEIVPMIKEAVQKKFTDEEQVMMNTMVDNFINNLFNEECIHNLETDPLIMLGNRLSKFKNTSFNETIDKFYNAIITVIELSETITDFENIDNKDLFSLLNIIRENLSKVPKDEDHGPLLNEYRKSNLRSGTSDFMDKTLDYQDIKEAMKILNKDFISLMSEENIEEYIKKVGILWYKFMLVHPYADGNGRTGRFLLNTLLANRDIVIPSLYNSELEQTDFLELLDNHVVNTVGSDYEGLGVDFLEYIKKIAPNALNSNQSNELVNNDIEVIDVSMINTEKENSKMARGVDPNIMNISYKAYDFVYKTDGDVNAVINKIIKDNKSGKVLLELNDTVGLTIENLKSLPNNVEIRVLGEYNLENFGDMRSDAGPLNALNNVTYTKDELISIIKVINDFESGIDDNWNDTRKAEYAYNFLTNRIEYTKFTVDNEGKPAGNATRASHFDGLTNLLVNLSTCQGFAHTYRELLTRIGIKCYEVSGKIVGGHSQHAFNVVTLDGKNYIVDTTRNKFVEDYERRLYNENPSDKERIELKKEIDNLNAKYSDSGFGVEKIDQYVFKTFKELKDTLVTPQQVKLKKAAKLIAKQMKNNNYAFAHGFNLNIQNIFNGIKTSSTERAQNLEKWARTEAINKINEFFGEIVDISKINLDNIILLEEEEFNMLGVGTSTDGFNNGIISIIKIPKSAIQSNVYEKIIHELLHQFSSNEFSHFFDIIDKKYHSVSGFNDYTYNIELNNNNEHYVNENDNKYEGFNEAVTEYFAGLIIPELSNYETVAYYNALQSLKRIINLKIDGFDIETLKKCYISNDITPLKQAINTYMGDDFFDKKLMPAFDASIKGVSVLVTPGDKNTKAVREDADIVLNRLIGELETTIIDNETTPIVTDNSKEVMSHTLKMTDGSDFEVSYSLDEINMFNQDVHFDSDGFYNYLVEHGRISSNISIADWRYAIANYGIDGIVLNTGAVVDLENITNLKQAAIEFSEGNKFLENVLLELWNKGYKTHACCSGHEESEVAYISFRIYNESDYLLYKSMVEMLSNKYSVEFFLENNIHDYPLFSIYDYTGNSNQFFKDIISFLNGEYVVESTIVNSNYHITDYYDSLLPEGYSLYINGYTGDIIIVGNGNCAYIPSSPEIIETSIENAITRLNESYDVSNSYQQLINEINSNSDIGITKVFYLGNYRFIIMTKSGPYVLNASEGNGDINKKIKDAVGYKEQIKPVEMTFTNSSEDNISTVDTIDTQSVTGRIIDLIVSDNFSNLTIEEQIKAITEIDDYDTLSIESKVGIFVTLLEQNAAKQGLTLKELGSSTGKGVIDKDVLDKANALADNILNEINNIEPTITKLIESFEDNDCITMGLEHNIKGKERLAAKIISDSQKNNITLEKSADSMHDALRYTLIIDPENYTAKALEVLKKLQSYDYEIVRASNRWDSEAYKGLNTLVKTSDGLVFEVQFHTPDSFAVKEIDTHLYYEIERNENVDEYNRELAREIQKILFSEITIIPDGIIGFDFMKELSEFNVKSTSLENDIDIPINNIQKNSTMNVDIDKLVKSIVGIEMLSDEQKDILRQQIVRYITLSSQDRKINPIKYDKQGKYELQEGDLIHVSNINNLDSIAQKGILNGQALGIEEFFETYFCADFFRVPQSESSSTFTNNFRENYTKGLPSDYDMSKPTIRSFDIAFVVSPTKENKELLSYDPYTREDNISPENTTVTKTFVNERGLLDKDDAAPYAANGGYSSILYGVPANQISTVMVGNGWVVRDVDKAIQEYCDAQKYLVGFDSLKPVVEKRAKKTFSLRGQKSGIEDYTVDKFISKIHELFPTANIVSYDGTVLYDSENFKKNDYSDNSSHNIVGSLFRTRSNGYIQLKKALKNGLFDDTILVDKQASENMITVLKSLDLTYVKPEVIKKYSTEKGFDFAGFLNYALLYELLDENDINKLMELSDIKYFIANPEIQIEKFGRSLYNIYQIVKREGIQILSKDTLLNYISFLTNYISRDVNFRIMYFKKLKSMANWLGHINELIVEQNKNDTVNYKGVNITLYGTDIDFLSTALKRTMKMIDKLPTALKKQLSLINGIKIFDTVNPKNLSAFFENAAFYKDPKETKFISSGNYNLDKNIIRLFINTFDGHSDVELLDTIAHETAHALDGYLSKILCTKPNTYFTEELNTWANAKRKDGNSVSAYGDSDIVEDFAVMFGLYATYLAKYVKMDDIAEKYPERMKLLSFVLSLSKYDPNNVESIPFDTKLLILKAFDTTIGNNTKLINYLLGENLINEYKSFDSKRKVALAKYMVENGICNQFMNLFIEREFIEDFTTSDLLALIDVYKYTEYEDALVEYTFLMINQINKNAIVELNKYLQYNSNLTIQERTIISNLCQLINSSNMKPINVYKFFKTNRYLMYNDCYKNALRIVFNNSE